MDYRSGETPKTHFRSDRLYCVDNSWFFSTREGAEVGPFVRKGDAQAELFLFMRHLNEGGFMSEADMQKYQQSIKGKIH